MKDKCLTIHMCLQGNLPDNCCHTAVMTISRLCRKWLCRCKLHTNLSRCKSLCCYLQLFRLGRCSHIGLCLLSHKSLLHRPHIHPQHPRIHHNSHHTRCRHCFRNSSYEGIKLSTYCHREMCYWYMLCKYRVYLCS
jgi:hypothetical protein